MKTARTQVNLMNVPIRPLFSSLRRNPTGAVLVALQVAITLAVMINAAWIVAQRLEKLERPTGIDTRDTFEIGIVGSSRKFNVAQAESEDLAYLRGLPGVAAATVVNGILLTENGGDTDLSRDPGTNGPVVGANFLTVDDQALNTLDVPLIAGRNFRADEIRPLTKGKQTPPSEVIVTQSLARTLFPHGSALGRIIYNGDSNPLTVIGITRDFMGPQVGAPAYNTVLLPTMPGQAGLYALLVRTRPGMRDTVMREAKQHIGTAHRFGITGFSTPLAKAERQMHAGDRNTAILLTTVTALMLAVCCLGVFGLTTFNVGSRRRQIGTRRALGASKRDIVAHFMMEGALILSGGAFLGSILALVVGNWLTVHYALPRLDLVYLLGGVLALWIVGLLAAWQPARRAADVPPSVATRTV